MYEQGGVNYPTYLLGSGMGLLMNMSFGKSHLANLATCLASPMLLKASHQFLYYEHDPVAKSTFIESTIDQLKATGANVSSHRFPEHEHVRLLRVHPEKTTELIHNFLSTL